MNQAWQIVALCAFTTVGCGQRTVLDDRLFTLHEEGVSGIALLCDDGEEAVRLHFDNWTRHEGIYALWSGDAATGVVMAANGRVRRYDLSDIDGVVTQVAYIGEDWYAADADVQGGPARFLYTDLQTDGTFGQGYMFDGTSAFFENGVLTARSAGVTYVLDSSLRELEQLDLGGGRMQEPQE